MKYKPIYLKISKALAAIAIVVASLLPAMPVSAAAGSISLTANRSTVPAGGTLIVALYMNGGGNAVYGVQTSISYPASKLQYVGLSYSGSPFTIAAAGGGGGGVVTIDRGTTAPVSGSALVATITFKALAGSGSAAIGVSGDSALADGNGNAVPFSTRGVSVNFGGSSASSSAASSGGGSAVKSSAPAAPAPPKDATPPVISNIKLKDVTPYSATVTWITNEVSDSAVDYGLDATYGLGVSSKAGTTNHSVALSSAFLTPEGVFHYRVKSADGAGNVATSPDQTIQLPGVTVTVVVRGADGKPQEGASVTIDNSTGVTDKNGKVTLSSGLGNKRISSSYGGVTVTKPITVAKTAKPMPPYQLDLSNQPLNHWMLTSIGLLLVVLTLLGIDAVLFGSRVFSKIVGIHIVPRKLLHSAGHDVVTSVASGRMATMPEKPEVEPLISEDQPPAPVNDEEKAEAVEDVVASLAVEETLVEPTKPSTTPTITRVPPLSQDRPTLTHKEAPISIHLTDLNTDSPPAATTTESGNKISDSSGIAPRLKKKTTTKKPKSKTASKKSK